MSRFWQNQDYAKWQNMDKKYEMVIAKIAKTKKQDLNSLDAWYVNEFSSSLQSQQYMTQLQASKLMTWKLCKGKFRPRLQKFIDELSDSDVKDATTKGIACLKSGDTKAAFKHFTALKGVGPATASAIAAAYDGNYPFMGDEALEAVAAIIGKRVYTMPHYLEFKVLLEKKAAWLNEKSIGIKWDAQRVQRCLYTAAYADNSDEENEEAEQCVKKRKLK